MRHHQTIVTSPCPSGQLILALCPRAQAWCLRSHRCCRSLRPRASPCPERNLRAVRASSRWSRMSISGQKPDRLSKRDEAHRIYPGVRQFPCQNQCRCGGRSYSEKDSGIPTFLLRHLSQALETLLRRGAFGSEPSSIEEGQLWRTERHVETVADKLVGLERVPTTQRIRIRLVKSQKTK